MIMVGIRNKLMSLNLFSKTDDKKAAERPLDLFGKKENDKKSVEARQAPIEINSKNHLRGFQPLYRHFDGVADEKRMEGYKKLVVERARNNLRYLNSVRRFVVQNKVRF